MKVYISGPMTGIEDYNYPAFQRAAEKLRDLNIEVVSPAELDEKDGRIPFEKLKDEPYGSEYVNLLTRDVQHVLSVDAIVALPGWDKSRGAKFEAYLAAGLGKPVYEFDQDDGLGDVIPLGELKRVNPLPNESILDEAARLVSSDRQEQYGHPIIDFTRQASMMSVMLGTEVKPEQIPLLMIAVKISRIIQSPTKRDSLVDIVGYVLTYEMVMEKKGTPLT